MKFKCFCSKMKNGEKLCFNSSRLELAFLQFELFVVYIICPSLTTPSRWAGLSEIFMINFNPYPFFQMKRYLKKAF